MHEHTNISNSPSTAPVSPEAREKTIDRNIAFLEFSLLGAHKELRDDMRLRSGIQTAEIWKDEHDTNLMHMGIAIEYDTQTGEIGFDLQATEPVGAHTRLRTSFDYKSTMYQVQGSWVTDYQSASIRLLRQSGAPTVEQLNAYVMHEEVPEPEFRVVPERVIPEYPQLVGLHDRWGEDTYGLGIDPSGDDIVLDTLRRFNALHGPRG